MVILKTTLRLQAARFCKKVSSGKVDDTISLLVETAVEFNIPTPSTGGLVLVYYYVTVHVLHIFAISMLSVISIEDIFKLGHEKKFGRRC